MAKFYLLLLSVLLFCSTGQVTAQEIGPVEDSILMTRGEIVFSFSVADKDALDSLTQMISIDHYRDGVVTAYANHDEFLRFLKTGYSYTILPNPSSLVSEEELNMGNIQRTPSAMTIWNFYPTYSQYLTYMNNWATTYPNLCRIDTIGYSNQGRLLLALKISDSINYERGVPEVFLTSSIHGDEITGYVLMMHLIDTLLNSWGTSTRLTNMVKNAAIYINPLANPDGTYYGGSGSVVNARRANQFGVDMNRNYPDPDDGQHPDAKIWQQETVHMMNYAARHHFSLAMNFHGGAEVVNYPWDTWCPPTVTVDDAWWQYVSKQYADTAHFYGTSGYFTNPYASGYTNGCAWYTITGGRQDYHNHFRHVREVTLEISNTKLPAASTLLTFWKSNYRSFFNYIEHAQYGINGKVFDSITGAPVAAKVFINGFDADSSFVYSSLPTGWYFRMISPGTRNITFSAPGYHSRTILNVTSTLNNTTRLNVRLRPLSTITPGSFLATAISGRQINLSWLPNSAGNYVMIAVSAGSAFGTPVTGTAYPAGSSLPGGATVIYNGPATAFAHTGLNPNTRYYYQAWSVQAGNSYSPPVASNATTHCGVYDTFPLTESFNAATTQPPDCWSQEALGDSKPYTNPWLRSNSSNAGGSAWEMRLPQNASVTSGGLIRLRTISFNTIGASVVTLSFKHRLTSSGTGATLSVQSSSDGITWTSESWSLTTPTGTSTTGPATVTVNIAANINRAATMIAFVATGNLSRITNWYIDDVTIKAPGYWVGGTPGALNDWNTGTNWGDGLVPTATTHVYVPQRTYLPVVSNLPATPAQCNNLTVSGNAAVTVGSGKNLQINGNFIVQGP